MLDADAGCDVDFRDGETVVEKLKRGGGIEQVESVVGGAREGERLAEAAGAGGKLAGRCIGRKTAVEGHLGEAGQGLQGANQYAAGGAFDLAGDIHAEITAVDGIDIGMAWGAEDDAVPRRGAAIGMSGRVGWIVVRAEVGFDFDNATSKDAGSGFVRKDFPEQARGHLLGVRFQESAGEPVAGKTNGSHR